MSLILKQEPANTIATPPAGKSTLFVDDNSVMSVKSPDGNVTTFPTASGSNTQVYFNDNGALNGNANLVFDKTTGTLTARNVSVTGTLNAGDISVSSIANGTSNVDIVGVSGNVTTSVGGNANILVVTGTGANIAGTLSASGNANVGNLGTTGNISAGGVKTDNLYYANGSPWDLQLPAGSNTQLQFNNNSDFGASANLTFDTATNILKVTGTISGTGNANIGNIGTAGLITATGNLNAGNLVTGGQVSATGNVTGGNLVTSGTANVGNLTIQSGGTFTGDLIPATNYGGNLGNATNAWKDLYLSGTTITLGSQTVSSNSSGVILSNSAFMSALTISGNANIGNIGTGGLITATGNITGGNIITAGVMSSTGNATHGNISTGGLITATGNITGGNLVTGGVISATGNANVGNLGTAGLITATGNLNAGNIITAGVMSSTGNATHGNISTGGLVTATGNITGGNLVTGGVISATGNANVGNIGAAAGVFTTVAGSLTTASQPNITSLGTLTSVSVSGNANIGNIGTAGLITATGNLNAGNVITAGLLSATGGATFGANVAMTSKNITGLADPVGAQDAATKNYVDTTAQGLDAKASVNYATAAGLPAYTYNNGTAGVGATITASANGALSIDGQAVTAGQRILVKNETSTNAPYNGIYVVTNAGSAGAAFILTRSTDMNTWTQVPSAFTFVEGGSTNADTGWVCIADAGGTMGTTNITWTQFSGAGSYTAGTGLTLTGSVFSVNNSQSQITAVGTLTSLSVSGNANVGNIGTAGQLISSVATGTAPIVVSSTTRVGNLNVAYSNVSDYVGAGSGLSGNFYITLQSALSGNVQALGNTAFIANASNGALYATTFVGALSGAATSATTAGTVTTNAQPNITSTGTLASLSVSGNANIGNIGTAGLITATGNLNAGNLITAGLVSATGNVIANSKLLVGTSSTTLVNPVAVFTGSGATYSQLSMQNPTGTGSADITVYGNNGDDTQSWADMGFTGNTFNDANYTITAAGDGYFFTQGNSSFGGNMVIATGATGTTKDIIFGTGGFLTGNIKARLYNANGTFSVTGNVTAGNLTTGGLITATGNIGGGNINTGGVVSATGNVTGGNLVTGGLITVTGNANIGNIGTGGLITATGNVTGSNIISTTNHIFSVATGISAAGTVQANATAITKDFNVVSTVASGAGVVLPTAVAGMNIGIINTSANAVLVYPAVNGIINSQAANASYSLASNAKLQFVATSTTQWYTLNATFA